MKCIHVLLNGKPYCTAGHESVDDLAVQITYAPSSDVGFLSVIGVFPKRFLVHDPTHPWMQAEITLNDQVTVCLVESDEPDVTTTVSDATIESGKHRVDG